MAAINKLRNMNIGIDVSKAHSKTRQAAKKYPLVYAETCFSGRSRLTMQQLQEMSMQRQNKKEL